MSMIRDLGDGLILRRATQADTEELVAFDAAVQSDGGMDSPDELVGAWVRDLMSDGHPTIRPGDFTVVVDTRSGQIVSSLNLISQTWTYDGVPFGAGQPELVATHPDYRRRGLVRAQFEVVHRWSAERGELVQGVTGIPNYYRQFGYEMALELDGGRMGYGVHVPRLKEGEAEPFHVRRAAEADVSFLGQVYDAGCRRGPIACVRDEALWRYEIHGKSEKNVNGRVLCVIETPGGEPVGFLAHPGRLWGQGIYAQAYELMPGVSWLAVTPSVVRSLWSDGEAYAARDGVKDLQAFGLWLGKEHPVYHVFGDRLPRTRDPYAWYLRVPDLAGFLRRIAPALERRLAQSWLPGHSGELTLSFYRDGLKLSFEGGRLVGVERWVPGHAETGDAAFPDLTFLQLLFGYRSLDELEQSFADCWASGDKARPLLEALFPRQPSNLWWVT